MIAGKMIAGKMMGGNCTTETRRSRRRKLLRAKVRRVASEVGDRGNESVTKLGPDSGRPDPVLTHSIGRTALR